MKKFIQDFKDFALKGNVIDLAIGVVIGGAFSTIVKSLVNDIIMPLFGLVLGGVNFDYLKITLKEATAKHPAVTLNIGSFIQNVINFLIISVTIFVCIKLASKLYKKKDVPDEPLATPEDVLLLQEIRDLLKSSKGEETNVTVEIKESIDTEKK